MPRTLTYHFTWQVRSIVLDGAVFANVASAISYGSFRGREKARCVAKQPAGKKRLTKVRFLASDLADVFLVPSSEPLVQSIRIQFILVAGGLGLKSALWSHIEKGKGSLTPRYQTSLKAMSR